MITNEFAQIAQCINQFALCSISSVRKAPFRKETPSFKNHKNMNMLSWKGSPGTLESHSQPCIAPSLRVTYLMLVKQANNFLVPQSASLTCKYSANIEQCLFFKVLFHHMFDTTRKKTQMVSFKSRKNSERIYMWNVAVILMKEGKYFDLCFLYRRATAECLCQFSILLLRRGTSSSNP